MKKKNFIKSGIKNKISNQKGMALLATLIFVFILVTFGVALLTMTSNDSKLSTLQRESTRAFYLAETGVEKALWYFNTPVDLGGEGLMWLGPLHDGTPTEFYDVNISYDPGPPEIKTLLSTGKVTGGGDYNKGTRTIEVKLKKGIAPSPHLTYDYAVLTDGDMTLNGGITLHGNTHSNSNLTNNGTINMEYGSITATKEIIKDNSGLATYQAYQEFPHIYWDYYEDMSKTQETIDGHTYNNYYSGDVTFNASDTLYGIYFIDGNVTINADLILHDAIICATKSITVQQGGTEIISEKVDSLNPLSLIAKGIIEIKGGTSFHGEGVIQTESEFILDGNVNIQKGAIYADDGIFNGGGGGMNVYYDTNLADIVVPGTGIPVWKKLSWQEVY
jgi:hypothetical protein